MHNSASILNRNSAIVLLTTLFAAAPLASAAQPVFDRVESNEFAACGDDGAWVHDAAVFTYFKDSYYDLDVRFLAFSGTVAQRIKTAAAMKDASKQLESYAFLHEQALGLIPRIGRLLPRMQQPLDLAPMIEQMRAEEIGAPVGNHRTEYLRVAFARQMLTAPTRGVRQPGTAIADFLTHLAITEDQLLTLKSGGEIDRATLEANLVGLGDSYRDSFKPVTKQVIFGPYASSLNGRLAFAVKQICESDTQKSEALIPRQPQ